MALDTNPARSPVPELELHVVKFVGGTEAATKVYGEGVTVAWSATGIYTVTWADNPGEYLGLIGAPSLEATTAADIKGHTAVVAYASSVLTVNVTNASDALHDLAALEWLTLGVAFKRVTV